MGLILDTLAAFERGKVTRHKYTELKWTQHAPQGSKPGFAEADITSWFDETDLYHRDITRVTIRRYPARHFVAYTLSPDDEEYTVTEYTQDGDGDGVIGGGGPALTVILMRIPNSQFVPAFQGYMGQLYSILMGANHQAIYLAGVVKGWNRF